MIMLLALTCLLNVQAEQSGETLVAKSTVQPDESQKKLSRLERLKLQAKAKFSRSGTTGELEAKQKLAEDALVRERSRSAARARLAETQRQIDAARQQGTAAQQTPTIASPDPEQIKQPAQVVSTPTIIQLPQEQNKFVQSTTDVTQSSPSTQTQQQGKDEIIAKFNNEIAAAQKGKSRKNIAQKYLHEYPQFFEMQNGKVVPKD